MESIYGASFWIVCHGYYVGFFPVQPSYSTSLLSHHSRHEKQESSAIAGEPPDAAIHFDTYRILQQHLAVSLLQHGFLVGLCLQTTVNHLLKSDKY